MSSSKVKVVETAQKEVRTNPEFYPALSGKPPYRASWLDRLFAWIQAAPGPAWRAYVALLLILSILFGGIHWLSGLQPVYIALLVGLDGASYIVYYLAFMHYLNISASRALRQFRPLLQTSDSDYALLHYQLTTLPAANALIASAIGLLVTLATLPITPANALLANIVRQPSAQIAFLLGNAILSVCVYQTIRQLRLVNRIHASVAHLNLFRRGPLYAFSKVTAITALGWILGLSSGLSPRIGPLLTIGNLLFFWTAITPLAILLFILPLRGVNRLLAREKARMKDEVEQRLETVLLRVHAQQDAQQLDDLTELKTLLDTLLVERDIVAKLPTWPWQSSTLAGFASALLLPVAIWLIQQLLSVWLSVN